MSAEKDFLKIRLEMIGSYVVLDHALTDEEYAKLDLYEGYLRLLDPVTRHEEEKRLIDILYYGSETEIVNEYNIDFNTLPQYLPLTANKNPFDRDEYERPYRYMLIEAIIRERRKLTLTGNMFDYSNKSAEELQFCKAVYEEIDKLERPELHITSAVLRELKKNNIFIPEQPAITRKPVKPGTAQVFRPGAKTIPANPAYKRSQKPASTISMLKALAKPVVVPPVVEVKPKPVIKAPPIEANPKPVIFPKELPKEKTTDTKPVATAPLQKQPPQAKPEQPTVEEKLKTVSEFAHENSITIQTVYRYISRGIKKGYSVTKDLKNKRGQRVKYITEDGEKIIKEYFM